MINYTKATVFNTPSQAIVNTVNCLGVMGAGLALEFKLRYPKMYEDYYQKCQKKQVKTGVLCTYNTEDNLLIINFPTKFNWRYPSKMEWLEQGLKYFTQHYQSWRIKSVAFPKLGCEHGGLDWQNVKVLMEKYLTNLQDLDVYICLDSELEPQGAEKVMLELLNQTKLWIEGLKINANISQKIIANLPRIKRFRHLQKTSGIGKETYQKLFQFLYSLAKEKTEKLEKTITNNKIAEQQSLLNLVPQENNYEVKNKTISTSRNNNQVKNTTIKSKISESNLLINNKSLDNEDLRGKSAFIFSELNIQAEEMQNLTWDSLIKVENEYKIKLNIEKNITIPINIWDELQQIKRLHNVTNNNELIISSKKKGKSTHNQPLAVNTIKKIISQERKKQAQLQQLELPLGN